MGLVLDPLAPEVRAGWRAWNAPFEGDVRTMYRDVRGFVTCAVGFLINSPQAATALRWSNNDGSPASTAAVVAEWHRVFGMPPALAWYAYAGGAMLSGRSVGAPFAAASKAAACALLRGITPGLPSALIAQLRAHACQSCARTLADRCGHVRGHPAPIAHASEQSAVCASGG